MGKKTNYVSRTTNTIPFSWCIFLALFMPFNLYSQSITHVYTNFDGGWSSGVGDLNSTHTNDESILLGFTVNGITYSTGIDDALLESLHGSNDFERMSYAALPVENIEAQQSGTFVGIPYKWEGTEQLGGGSQSGYDSLPQQQLPYYLTNGDHGLDLGTAVFNISNTSNSEYPIETINLNEINNSTAPAIIVTQMGQPSARNFDEFKFVDENGVTVGNAVSAQLGSIAPIGKAVWAFFDPHDFTYPSSQPGSGPPSQNTRDTRLRIFNLEEFGLNESNYEDVVTFVHSPSGESDIAFIAAFDDAFSFILADLEITKEVDKTEPVMPGTEVSFTIEVTNNGPDNASATEVVVTDQLPSGYTFTSATPAGAYNSTTGIWDIGDLAFEASETLTINATVNATGDYLNTATVEGYESDPDITNNLSSASVTVLEDITIDLTGGPCWRMLSSPTEGLTYADMLEERWTQGSGNSDHPSGEPNVLTWDISTQDWTPVTNLNDVIPPGQGFIISIFDLDDFEDSSSGGWDKTITIPAGAEHTAPFNVTNNTADDGDWILMGNPFQSNINTAELTENASGLAGAYYVYDRNSGGFVSTAVGYGDLIDASIAVGQGFFVQASAANPSLDFTEDSKTDSGEFYGKQNELRDYIRLEVRGESFTNSTWLRFSADGSENTVYGDAVKLQPLSEQYTLLASRKTDGTLTDIGHYPIPNDELAIPVSFQTTQPGTYTISATDLNLPAGGNLWFTDLETNTSMPVNSNFEYTFSIGQAQKTTPSLTNGIALCTTGPAKAQSNENNRFVITSAVFEDGDIGGEIPNQTDLKQNYPNPFNPTTVIHFNIAQTSSNVQLEVFDTIGRQVATLVNGTVQAGNHTVSFDGSNLNSGVYLYRLSTDNRVITKQMILIK